MKQKKTEYLNDAMRRYSDAPIKNGFIEKIGEGDYRVAQITEGDIKVQGISVNFGNGNASIIIGTTKEESKLKDIRFFIRNKFLGRDISF